MLLKTWPTRLLLWQQSIVSLPKAFSCPHTLTMMWFYGLFAIFIDSESRDMRKKRVRIMSWVLGSASNEWLWEHNNKQKCFHTNRNVVIIWKWTEPQKCVTFFKQLLLTWHIFSALLIFYNVTFFLCNYVITFLFMF